MKITSPIFNNQSSIPDEYGFMGKNKNPPIIISDVPSRAKSLALIMHDPDAWGGRDFLHWMVWNISKDTTHIEAALPEGAVLGINDKGAAGYMRPAPLKGSGIHRYIFELYALDAMLSLPHNADRASVENAINEHLIEKAELTGLYTR
jgi:Raf kinase inhibitor-like YbhB/YbcL family protein